MDFRKSVDEPKLSVARCDRTAGPSLRRRNRNANLLRGASLQRLPCGSRRYRALLMQRRRKALRRALTKVVFSLDFIPLGRHAPWYAAIAEGYFKDEGLDVIDHPVTGRRAGDPGTLSFRHRQHWFHGRPGSRYRPLRPAHRSKWSRSNYQKAPYRGFQPRKAAPMSPTPKQLEGLTLGSGRAASRPKSARFHGAERARSEQAHRQRYRAARRASKRAADQTSAVDRILRHGRSPA